jgi:hypothetical protein
MAIAIGGDSMVPIEIAGPTVYPCRERTRLEARGAAVDLGGESIGIKGRRFVTVVGRSKRVSCHGESSRFPRKKRREGKKKSVAGHSQRAERRSRNEGNGLGEAKLLAAAGRQTTGQKQQA